MLPVVPAAVGESVLTEFDDCVIVLTVLGKTDADWRTEQHEAARERILQAAWAQAAAEGIGALSLRGLARTLGMTAPSLYSYFPSKDAIFDAMYAQSWQELGDHMARLEVDTGSAHEQLSATIRAYLQFCNDSLARYELMSRRPVPGWEPSPSAYAVAVAVRDSLVALLASIGVTDPRRVDLYTAVAAGLAAQQMSNEPGGDRWVRLSGEAADMLLAHFTNGDDE